MSDSVVNLFDEMLRHQEAKLLSCAREIVPHLTADDILQPNDYPQLEMHPFFRYEEGVLKGIHSAKMAYSALKKDRVF